MRKYDFVMVKERQIVEYKCDVCGLDLTDDIMERQECFHTSQVGGFSSVFGDGVEIYLDICQHCFKKIHGEHCTII